MCPSEPMPDDRPDTEAWRDEPLICDEPPEPVYAESEGE